MNHARLVVAAVMAAAAFLGLGGVAQASHLSPAAQGHVSVYNSSANWDGARAKIEVRQGDISLDDANDGLIVSQHLLIADYSAHGTDYFVRTGIMRQQNDPDQGENGIATVFYWLTRNASGDHLHLVPSPDAGTYNGQQPFFRICRESSGNSSFAIKIDGEYADDSGGDHLASPGFTQLDYIRVGLVTNASSGHYGTSANPADNTTIQRSTDYGGSWDYAGSSYAQDAIVVDSQGLTGADWTTRVQSSWDYRNSQ